MGILVPEATLPSGIYVSNVYMSFSGEVVYVTPRNEDGRYRVNTWYRVYKDDTRQPDTNIRIPMSVTVNDIGERHVYDILYEELRALYQQSTNIL
jgi:hypothetical protein